MGLYKSFEKYVTPYANILLLAVVFIFIFLTPFMPKEHHRITGQVLFTVIFITSIFALETGRKAMWFIVAFAVTTEWISIVIDLPGVFYISSLLNILFFQIVVIKLLIQVARSNKTDASVILEAINGYLMLGLLFTTWVAIAMEYDPGAFSFYPGDLSSLDYTYFTFVTMTTLGYGDVAPQLPFARSLSILISISGQLYVAVIIAMLVGKYAGAMASETRKEE